MKENSEVTGSNQAKIQVIEDAIIELVKFSDKEGVTAIIRAMESIQLKLKDETIDLSLDIIELRKQLKNFLSKDKVKKDNISLAETAYLGLLALAQIKPINEVDPITLDI